MQWDQLSSHQEWLRGEVQALARLRAQHSAMRRGARSTLHAAGDVYVYRMIDRREIIYVALNRGDAERTADGLPAGSYRDLRTGETLSEPVSLAPRSYRILVRPD
jgi:hypothetical protein